MPIEQVFLSEGAFFHGARLIHRGQDVGVLGDAGVVLTAAGEAVYATLSEITDVEVKVKAPRTKKPAAEDTPETSLDELLGE